MASPWTSTCIKVILPLLFLTFPFGVILAILLRLPTEDITMGSTDMYSLAPVSDFWCGSQQVVSTHPFYTYKTNLPLHPTDTFTHNLAFRFALRKQGYHLLRYYLLTGSLMQVSGCSSERGAWLDVVNEESLHLCLNPQPEDDSSEEQDDSFEVQDYTKGCSRTLLTSELEVSGHGDEIIPTCRTDFGSFNTVPIDRTGVYYVVVRSNTKDKVLNNVLLHLRLNRTIFELPDDMILCRSETTCDIPLTFGSSERVVVFMSPEPDAGNVVFPVQSKCKPRMVFYILSSAFVPAFFIIIMWMAVRNVRQRRYRQRVVFVLAQDRTSPVSAPLLKESTPESERLSNEPPPPYNLHGDLPPPYEVVNTSS